MSQNFSEMFVPELMELDSYWQKAVEDAICDTLKGEKRLHYALRNRKKINQKLEKLGLKSGLTQVTLANRLLREDNSASSVEENASKKNLEPPRSKSRSRTFRETPSENKYKSPERPFLGDGSLEKMKKSENSFNCEPMGEDNLELYGDECESEKNDEEQFRSDETNKKIQWLHVREDTEFDDSDSESSLSVPIKDENVKSEMDQFSTLRHTLKAKGRESDKKDWQVEAKDDEFWEKKDKNGVRGARSLDRRLQVALAKRKIVNGALQGTRSGRKLQVSASGAQVVGRRRKRASGASLASAFIQLYLEVYRELFQKCSPKEIESEATRRWWCMTAKQKSKYANKKFNK